MTEHRRYVSDLIQKSNSSKHVETPSTTPVKKVNHPYRLRHDRYKQP